MTPHERYQTLNQILSDIKQEDFRLYIKGVDELFMKHKTILLEACNTSFQIHLQIDPDEAIAMYNWSQMIAGPVLALATNSSHLMGRELWSETRIALFQQSIDTRNTTYLLHEERPRVGFGNEWVIDSIVDVYKDDVARYPVILTSDEVNEDSMVSLKKGVMPELQALNLHTGTLYKWNRLCYGVHQNIAHFRIENRYIPSGPTVEDEVANTLFWVGVMRGMPKEYSEIWKLVNFKDASANFNNAAQLGIEATFNWFDKSFTARRLAEEVLIPMAEEGLKKSKISQKDIRHYLKIIKDRLKNNITGSKWATRSFRKLRDINGLSKDEANVLITAGMYSRERSGKPVSEWDLVHANEGVAIPNKYDTVAKVMETHLFAVNENDPIRLVKKLAKWKKIEHLPVVNADQNIVGAISTAMLKEYKATAESYDKTIPTKEVMSRSVVMITTDTTVEEALKIIEKQHVNCLFVMESKHLVGIFTKDKVR
jgi:CBS domain-containing protein